MKLRKLISVLLVVTMLVGCQSASLGVTEYKEKLGEQIDLHDYVLNEVVDKGKGEEWLDNIKKAQKDFGIIKNEIEKLAPPEIYKEEHQYVINMIASEIEALQVLVDNWGVDEDSIEAIENEKRWNEKWKESTMWHDKAKELLTSNDN